MYEILVFLVLLNAGITGYLWKIVRRGPKREFLKALLHGKPITPKHQPPSRLEGIDQFITDADRQFFATFDRFANVLNNFLAHDEPWRLQERPDTELSGYYEAPQYGRRYEIFYNQFKIGILQIHPHRHYSVANPIVTTEIEFDYARLLPFDRVFGLMSWVATLTAGRAAEGIQDDTRFAIYDAMLHQLWQIEFSPDLDDRNSGGSIDVQFDGSAANYIKSLA